MKLAFRSQAVCSSNKKGIRRPRGFQFTAVQNPSLKMSHLNFFQCESTIVCRFVARILLLARSHCEARFHLADLAGYLAVQKLSTWQPSRFRIAQPDLRASPWRGAHLVSATRPSHRQVRNPSLVTSSATAFGVRSLLLDEAPTFSQWDLAFSFLRCRNPVPHDVFGHGIRGPTTAFDEAPTFSQWDPAISLSHVLWHCPRGISLSHALALCTRRPRLASGTWPSRSAVSQPVHRDVFGHGIQGPITAPLTRHLA